jgi:hypothetical protein
MFRMSSKAQGITLLITGISVLLVAALFLWNIPNIVAYWADVFHAHRNCNRFVCRPVPIKPVWHTLLAFIASMVAIAGSIVIGCEMTKNGIALCNRRPPQ